MRGLLLALALACACVPPLPSGEEDSGHPDAAVEEDGGPPDAGQQADSGVPDAGKAAPDAAVPTPCETEAEVNARMGRPTQTCTYPAMDYATVDIWALDGGGFLCGWRPKAPDTCKRVVACLLPPIGTGFCD